MVPVNFRLQEAVKKDLARVAAVRGFTGYQPLMRHYIGQGLRQDLVGFRDQLEEADRQAKLEAALAREGMAEEKIAALAQEVFGH